MESEARRWPVSRTGVAIGTVLLLVYAAYSLGMRIGGSAVVPLPDQGEVSAVLNRIAPQGWAFFTKPTLSATPVAYQLDGAHPVQIAGFSNARLAYLGGLDRRGRRQGVEMASVLDGIPKQAWQPCDGAALDECLDLHHAKLTTNPLPHPTLCGQVAIVGLKPTPWQWRALLPRPTYPAESIVLDIRCGR